MDKSFSHGYNPTHNGLRSSPLLPSFAPSHQPVSVRNSIQSLAIPTDTEQLASSLPRPQKTEGRVLVANGRTRRRGSVGDINGLYRGLGPPPTPPPKPPHLSFSPISSDSSESTSRKSSRETESSNAEKSPVRTKFILMRRQSEPIGLSDFGDVINMDDLDARRQQRASTVPFEALPSNRMFIPRRSQPEFV